MRKAYLYEAQEVIHDKMHEAIRFFGGGISSQNVQVQSSPVPFFHIFKYD